MCARMPLSHICESKHLPPLLYIFPVSIFLKSHFHPSSKHCLLLGSNACYLEDIDNVGTWSQEEKSTEGSQSGQPRHVIINTEWGAFGDKVRKHFLDLDID